MNDAPKIVDKALIFAQLRQLADKIDRLDLNVQLLQEETAGILRLLEEWRANWPRELQVEPRSRSSPWWNPSPHGGGASKRPPMRHTP